jgi:hypothetical protein
MAATTIEDAKKMRLPKNTLQRISKVVCLNDTAFLDDAKPTKIVLDPPTGFASTY